MWRGPAAREIIAGMHDRDSVVRLGTFSSNYSGFVRSTMRPPDTTFPAGYYSSVRREDSRVQEPRHAFDVSIVDAMAMMSAMARWIDREKSSYYEHVAAPFDL